MVSHASSNCAVYVEKLYHWEALHDTFVGFQAGNYSLVETSALNYRQPHTVGLLTARSWTLVRYSVPDEEYIPSFPVFTG